MGQKETVLEMLRLMTERFGDAFYDTLRENADQLGLQVEQKDTEAFVKLEVAKPYAEWILNTTPSQSVMKHGTPTTHAGYIWGIVEELGRLESKMKNQGLSMTPSLYNRIYQAFNDVEDTKGYFASWNVYDDMRKVRHYEKTTEHGRVGNFSLDSFRKVSRFINFCWANEENWGNWKNKDYPIPNEVQQYRSDVPDKPNRSLTAEMLNMGVDAETIEDLSASAKLD